MKEIKQIDLEDVKSISDLMKEYSKLGVFGAGRLGKAVDIFEHMIKDKNCFKILTLSGALIPGGLRKVLCQVIKDGFFDLIVSTGANVTHDIASCFGEKYFKVPEKFDDVELGKKEISRIYEVLTPDKGFIEFEKGIQEILSQIPEERRDLGSFELMEEIGKRLKDENSFVRQAYLKKVKIFVPAIQDSILGLQLWLFSQNRKLNINPIKDLQEIHDITYDLKDKNKKKGVFILGGGVPKNYALQTALIPEKPCDYAIQITMARVEDGGLSGATLSEAKSWGKIKPNAETVTIPAEVTMVFPIIVKAVKERIEK